MKETGEIIEYGDAEVVDRDGGVVGGQGLAPMSAAQASALRRAGYGARMHWFRRNRPTLDQLAEQGSLTDTQRKALEKRDRKRRARLREKGAAAG